MASMNVALLGDCRMRIAVVQLGVSTTADVLPLGEFCSNIFSRTMVDVLGVLLPP